MKYHVPPHDEVPQSHGEVPLPHGKVPPPYNGMCNVPNAGSFDTNPLPYHWLPSWTPQTFGARRGLTINDQ